MAAALDSDLAVRLAGEGVPVAVIARAIRISSSDLRDELSEAISDGRLHELPTNDWPVGCPREQRPLQLARVERKDEIALAVGRRFNLTPSEARILLLLLQSPSLDKNRADMKAIDVHIHSIRKSLRSFGITVTTVWGAGYSINAKHRRKAMKLISQHVAP